MGPKEKYNLIINTIEELAKGRKKGDIIESISAHDISDAAFQAASCETMDDRSKNVLFLFLNNKTVLDYINERKMIAAYKMLLEAKEWNKHTVWKAVEMVGVSDEKALAKKFNKQFGISPKKAFSLKNYTLITEIRDWDLISKEGKGVFVNLGEEVMEETKFGISKKEFMLAQTAANLQSFYNLNELESDLAFELHKEKDLPLEETFEYIYNYVWSYVDTESEERDSRIVEDLTKWEVLYMYFECGMSFNEIIVVLYTLSKNQLPRQIGEADRKYLLGFRMYCKYNDSKVRQFLGLGSQATYEEIYQYYNENAINPANVEEYVEFVKATANSTLKQALEITALCKGGDVDVYLEEDYSEDDDIVDSDYDQIDYDVDYDDIDVVQDMWASKEYPMNAEFDFVDFEAYCDQLDANEDSDKDENKEANVSRKLIGYKSLDISKILSN